MTFALVAAGVAVVTVLRVQFVGDVGQQGWRGTPSDAVHHLKIHSVVQRVEEHTRLLHRLGDSRF
jgi:hypothetical protein